MINNDDYKIKSIVKNISDKQFSKKINLIKRKNNKKDNKSEIKKKDKKNNNGRKKIKFGNNPIKKNNNNKKNKNIIVPESNSINNINKSNSKNKNIIEKIKNIMKYNNDELNSLPYELATQYDERTFCQYYISLIKAKQLIIFSFFKDDDYNSKIIKIDLFFIGFSIHYAVNALFFNNETMHKIYINKGSYDLEYQIPLTIYSSLISIGLNTILKLLALSNDSIISFKQDKKIEGLGERFDQLQVKLKIKFIIFFIISFIFLFFFWYYSSVFGVIYKNTQFHLLKDSLISFCLSLIYPFGICLLPGFARIPSLSNSKENKRTYLYNFSKILQIL